MALQIVHDAESIPLDLDEKNRPRKTIGNVLTVLSCDPQWHGAIAYNSFSEQPVLLRRPPMREQDEVDFVAGAPWSPQDSTRTAAWIDAVHGFSVPSAMVTEAMLAVAQRTMFHPVLKYLDALEWDRQPRVDQFFARYCGAADNTYVRGVARMMLLSAVARVRQPGCKVDTITILEGVQGLKKSTMLSILAGKSWFADTPIVLGDKDSFQSLRGVWLYELAELDSIKGKDATRIKSFASSPVDHYRPSYAPAVKSVPRQCIFVGSTNDDAYLTDPTGARRFWPVKLPRMDLEAVARDRDQLWAEADALYCDGAPWWPDRTLDALGAEETDERIEVDAWADPIRQWLTAPVVRRWAANGGGEYPDTLDPAAGLAMTDVLTGALGIPVERQGKREQGRASVVLRQLGWERGRQRRGTAGERCRPWVRAKPR